MTSVAHVKRVYYSLEFLNWFAVAIPLPFVVLFMQARGLDLFQIGLLSGSYAITIVLLELPTGGLADTVGRKPVSLLSYLLAALSGLVFLVAFSFPIFAIAWILLGISRALASGALGAWFIDSLLEHDPDIDFQPALAQAGTYTILGLSLGTLMGGVIPKLFAFLPEEGSAVLTPLSMTILVSLGLKLLLILLLSLWVKEKRMASASKGATQLAIILKEAFKLTGDSAIIKWLLIGSFTSLLALTSVETFWQPQFSIWLNTDNSLAFAVLMMMAFVTGVVGNLASIPLTKLVGKRYGWVAAIAQVLAGVAILLLALQQSLFSSAGFFWLYYLGIAMSGSPVGAIANEEIPSERRSSMQSIMSLAGYAGAFIGSAGLGWIAETFSVSNAWLIAGSLVLLSSLIYLRVEALRK